MNDTLKKPEKYRSRYKKKHKTVSFVLDKEKDADIISWLGDRDNCSAAIRSAIRSQIVYHETHIV